MATWYLDPGVAGSDAAAGTSWSVPWKTMTTGATSARIAAGDTIRIAKTPDPVDTGLTATWNSGAYSANFWKSWITLGISSSTNANPVVITATAHTLITGDYIGISGHSTNTNANGVWPITYISANTFSIPVAGNGVGVTTGSIYKLSNQMLILSSPVTAVISNCDVIWTAGTSCVPTLESNSNSKDGIGSAKLTITTPATTLKLAYSTITSTDFSGYQQISFWIKNTVVVTAGQYTLNLCSDTAGATAVNSVAIPAIPSTGQWVALTIDTTSGLGSAIQSVALYTGATTGTSNVLTLDHIIACKASSSANAITLTSLIGKNNGTEGWFNIRSINGVALNFDQGVNSNWTTARGYYGTSETVELWRRETFKQPMSTATGGDPGGMNYIQKDGTAGNLITYTGGWNTSSNTQDGDTYWDGQNSTGCGIHVNSNFGTRNYIGINHINFSRFFAAIGAYDSSFGVTNCNFSIFNVTNCGRSFNGQLGNTTFTLNNISFGNDVAFGCISAIYANGQGCNLTFTNVFAFNGSNACVININGINLSTAAFNNFVASGGSASVFSGLIFVGGNGNTITGGLLTGVYTNNTSTCGALIVQGSGNILRNFTLSGNQNDIVLTSNVANLPNSLVSSTYSIAPTINSVNERFYMRNPNGTTSAKCFSDNMTCQTDLAIVHTSGNRSWNITTSRTLSTYPATLNLGYIIIQGSTTNTISAWVYYTSAGMQAGIQVVGNQIEGMTTTQQALSTGTINTWIQVTITITTATQSGPVQVQAYGLSSSGTQNMWIADISVS